MDCPRRDPESWSAYQQTILELPGGARVDLRRELRPADHAALRALGVGKSFALLTSENPCGESAEEAPPAERPRREAENSGRLSRLAEDLGARGVAFARVDGVAPDGSHRERCVAVGLEPRAARELARRFDQLALFHYDGERFVLLGAELDEAPTPLPAAGRNDDGAG